MVIHEDQIRSIFAQFIHNGFGDVDARSLAGTSVHHECYKKTLLRSQALTPNARLRHINASLAGIDCPLELCISSRYAVHT
jgi:hypothetical protein